MPALQYGNEDQWVAWDALRQVRVSPRARRYRRKNRRFYTISDLYQDVLLGMAIPWNNRQQGRSLEPYAKRRTILKPYQVNGLRSAVGAIRFVDRFNLAQQTLFLPAGVKHPTVLRRLGYDKIDVLGFIRGSYNTFSGL